MYFAQLCIYYIVLDRLLEIMKDESTEKNLLNLTDKDINKGLTMEIKNLYGIEIIY